jgi:hypothetical protein
MNSVNPNQLFHKFVYIFFNHFLQSEQLYTIINFIELKVILIYCLLQLFIIIVCQPRARLKSIWLNMIICYLAWLKLGQDYLVLACTLRNIITTQLKDNINCIYLILFQVLHEKWLFSLSCLKLLVDSLFPHIGIIIDNHNTIILKSHLMKLRYIMIRKTIFIV